MNILFLDDNQNRIDVFKRYIPWATTTTTAQETINQLVDNTWDHVFLDHDLGGEVFVDSDREDTGMEVVRWIVANQPKVGRFVVHSLNQPAAREMTLKLVDAGYEVDQVGFLYLLDCQIIQNLQKASKSK